MKTLALDLSSKSSGWAVFEDEQLLDSGVITASSTDLIKRIQKITNEIYEILNQYAINTVILEEVLPSVGHNSNTNVWKALTWLQASVVFMLHDNFSDIERKFVMPNSWRMILGIHTGRGIKRDVLKQADMQYVKDHFNKTVGDDEADAICLGYSHYLTENNEINWE